jgi:hypothetical protein
MLAVQLDGLTLYYDPRERDEVELLKDACANSLSVIRDS